MKRQYINKRFSQAALDVIVKANDIINEYAKQGYDLTLRQLYYQFVSRDFIPNNDKEYKRLGTIISDARRAGLIDWNRIVDRTRFLRTHSSWDSPEQIVSSCAGQFDVDWWANQKYRPEVWIEKDALIGVLEVACAKWQVPYFSCRGYVSDSEAWSAGRRYMRCLENEQIPIVFHLGDHDPSGIDMTRDIDERIAMFAEGFVKIQRVALTMPQVEQYEPPPNPAKITDTRFAEYQRNYGDESWELDALNPQTISGLIADHIKPLIDDDAWQESKQMQEDGREKLRLISDRWSDAIKHLRSTDDDSTTDETD